MRLTFEQIDFLFGDNESGENIYLDECKAFDHSEFYLLYTDTKSNQHHLSPEGEITNG